MSRLMDAWSNQEEEKEKIIVEEKKIEPIVAEQIENKKEPVQKKKVGRPSASIDRTKTIRNVTIKMTDNDFIYCNMLAKEMHEEGLCGADVSSLISYFIKESKKNNPLIEKAADAIYELQRTKQK